MRVRFLRSIVSERWDYQPGMLADVDDAQARAWCASGVAEPAEPETAMAAGPPEAAMKPRARGRRR